MRVRFTFTLLTAVLMILAAPFASAQDSNEVGECLADGRVWLLVVDDTESVLANQCVGNPESGDAALEAAGVEITRDSSGFICALDGIPAQCPETFTGQYWNYNHAAAGQQWSYSEVGSGDSQPAGGTIEGWCYNAEGTDSCFPPLLQVVQDGETILPEGVADDEVADLEVTGDDGADQVADGDADASDDTGDGLPVGVWLLWGTAGVAIAGGLAAVFIHHNRRNRDLEGGQATSGGR